MATDENNVQREGNGADKHEQVATIQSAKPLRRHREQINSGESERGASPEPGIDPAAAKDRKNDRNKNDARSGDEGRTRRSGELQPGSLKNIAAEHEKTNLHAGPYGGWAKRAKVSPQKQRHHHGGEPESHGDIGKNGNVREGLLYDDKRGAPNQGAECEG